MPTFVLMTKLSPATLQERRDNGQTWKRKVEALCPGLRWKAHYALLGPYDFMDIYEIDDPELAFQVSLLSRELGAVSAESWPAIPYEQYLPVAESVDKAARRKGKR